MYFYIWLTVLTLHGLTVLTLHVKYFAVIQITFHFMIFIKSMVELMLELFKYHQPS